MSMRNRSYTERLPRGRAARRRSTAPDTVQDLPNLLPIPSSESTTAGTEPADASPHYQILGSIHRGGMGEILLAKVDGPEGFSKKVVLKGLLQKLSEDDVSYQLFMREARLMSALDHPNIVRVFDLPYIQGKPYLAMEYLRGRNFHQVIQRAGAGGVPMRIALFVVAEILRGLHYAHSLRDGDNKPMGIIHRDVSPGNLLLSFFGEVKVTDFGIAKIADSPRYTGPRSIRGKARYVAPEQVHGENATVLSDVYSAGVVLAEALMGQPLWERASVPETLLAIVSEDREKTIERILQRPEHADVPGLKAALRGALSLNPKNRFASALQFAEVLESIAVALGGKATQVELGLYVRNLFKDAPDVPREDGFGRSGFPIPKFEIKGEDTDSTIINLEPGWMKAKSSVTTRIRPDDPREHSGPPPLPPLPIVRSAASMVKPQQPMVDQSKGTADTAVKGPQKRAKSRIKASAVSPNAAVLVDPAEPAQAYLYSDSAIALDTDSEESDQLDLRAARRKAPKRTASGLSLDSQRAMALLLAGIFIGASLALAGSIIALVVGR
ncbi:MAG: serine/threonine protein kinase [Deltaproteobacteria bacterium]|nr:serine/threonine protein kinase [Deltaproteobacteria bacterium]